MKKKILVYLPAKNNKLQLVGLELVGEAYRLVEGKSWEIWTLTIDEHGGNVEQYLPPLPVERAVVIQTNLSSDVNCVAEIFTAFCRENTPEIFLLGATPEGRAIAPIVAAKLNTGLTADCTELMLNNAGQLLQTRPAFEETVLATIQTKTLPQMATVRPGIALPVERFEPVQTRIVIRQAAYLQPKLLLLKKEENVHTGITDAKIILAIGGGVAKRDILVWEEYAKRIGAGFACSRKLVEMGWMLQKQQIGLSGTSVAPELLVTIGISGSTQFMAGIQRAKKLIAVNTDKFAPIFSRADHSIVMDSRDFVNALSEEV